MSVITYKVGKEGQDVKIRDYMKENLNLSGRFIRGSAMDRRLRVNGKEVKLNYKLQEDDVIEVTVNAEESQNIEGEDLNIKVIYEDDDLLIVDKPPFMVVHPTKSHPMGTLANGVIHHFRSNNDNSIVRLVSRLDRDTSGLIMIAKNQFSHMNLAKSMDKNLIKKSYLAIIHGNLENQEGTIDLPIGRPTDETIKRAVLENGQRSITHYKVKESYKEGTLVELVLETGRTHQIRVHLSYVGCPIYGEQLYSDFNDEELISRQALHAYGLTLPHPRSGEILNFESALPEDMTKLIHNLQSM
ncbi:MAG: RluA family pseudouridine synthase [Clostridium sulfidigenes]|uniref:Pseudouridine synthase n=1 Tax=Clostridium sulfidigenes TaxID=318464 RepID=A0A927W7J5_9CLOT|nr:RluA family pseudouridine synthase [Clostridium sulfidigenes]